MVGPWLEVASAKALRAGVLAAPVACLAGIFLMTAGTDESWIVSSIRGLAEHGTYAAESPYRSVQSTGGAFTVAVAALHVLGGGRLEVIRLISVLSLAGLLVLIWRLSDRVLGTRTLAPWIMSAALLAVPGTFMLGSQAYGEILATALIVAGALLWGTKPCGTWDRRLWTGLILGSAAATRLNCLVALAALPLAALMNRGRRRAELVDAGIALAAGAIVFTLLSQGQVWMSVDPTTAGRTFETSGLTLEQGLNLGYLIPLHLEYWSIAQGFLPFLVIAVILAGWAWARPQVTAPQGVDFLLCFALAMWGAWLLRAPIPHLRYAWPGLAAFAIVGGLVLAIWGARLLSSSSPWMRSAVAWFAVALLATGYLDAARTYQHGESDVLSWQWHRAIPSRIEFGPLRALRSQKAIVRRLNELPKEDIVATFGFDTALSLLTRRSIVPVRAYYPEAGVVDLQPLPHAPGAKPRWLAITPFVNRFPGRRITPELDRWIEQNCRLDCQFGPYVLYEVTGRYPDSPEVLSLHDWTPRR